LLLHVFYQAGDHHGDKDNPHSENHDHRSTCGLVFGGTSVASPSLAGIVNLAGKFNPSSNAELTLIYNNLGTANFRDIVSGTAGTFSCTTGWDFVTGVGSNQGTSGK